MPIIIPGNRLASTGYTIDQSLRFDAAATVNLIDSSVGAGDTRKKILLVFGLKEAILPLNNILVLIVIMLPIINTGFLKQMIHWSLQMYLVVQL